MLSWSIVERLVQRQRNDEALGDTVPTRSSISSSPPRPCQALGSLKRLSRFSGYVTVTFHCLGVDEGLGVRRVAPQTGLDESDVAVLFVRAGNTLNPGLGDEDHNREWEGKHTAPHSKELACTRYPRCRYGCQGHLRRNPLVSGLLRQT